MARRRIPWLLLFVCSLPIPVRAVDHTDLTRYPAVDGNWEPVQTSEHWERRRRDVLDNLQRVMGALPKHDVQRTIPVEVLDVVTLPDHERRRIRFEVAPGHRVPALLLVPEIPRGQRRAAVLCLHQTTSVGKDEPCGVRGDPELAYGLELVRRGFVVLAPDYPSLGEHPWDFSSESHLSGTMTAIHENRCAINVLQSLDCVAPARIGVIGHSLGAHNALFTAVFETRLKAVVSSCGFTALRRDDLPSWTGPRYMPRIASEFHNDPDRVPFDFHEVVAAIAPRPLLVSAAERDDDFDVAGVREIIRAATTVYRHYDATGRLITLYPPVPHSFPADARRRSIEFLEQALAP